MKLAPSNNRDAVSAFRLALTLATIALVPLLLYGSAPSWWAQRGVLVRNTTADDYAPINQGQLKNLAKAGVAEMDAKLTGGAGAELHDLIERWSPPAQPTNDYAPVNLGQLKEVARPFYDRLVAAGIIEFYPWLTSLAATDDFAVANIGQAKNLFSFDIPPANVLDDAFGDRLTAGQDSANLALEAHTIWVWGDHLSNNGDMLGYPRRISGLPSIRAVSAGDRHVVALDSDGAVWTWGANGDGQLGDGTNDSHSAPAQIPNVTNVASVKAGGVHTLALLRSGTVVAWGNNYYGQLGTGDTTTTATPALVTGLDDVRKIAAGYQRSVALKNDGTVWVWGYDHFAWQTEQELFNTVPLIVPNLTDVVDIAAGYEHNVAVKSDGTVWAWGSNYANQIGNGIPSWIFQDIPVQVSNLASIAKVASSYDHTLALAVDGTVWAWGYNSRGQLGDGTNQARELPVRVSGLTDVIAVATGYSYSLAMKKDGTVWAWGDGATGTLPGTNKRLPQLVGLGLLDTNHNGMDDRWELQVLGDLDESPDADFDGDGWTNLQEFHRGTDPFDYYNGMAPIIRITGGNQQQGEPDTFAPDPLAVQVVAANGNPLANAPVEFALAQGSGQLALSRNGTGDGTFLRVRTDANGNASVFYHFPPLANNVSVITVGAGGANTSALSFAVTTSNPPPPMAASEVMATKNPNGTVTLTWKDNSNNEEQFVIEMQDPDGTWQVVGLAPANTASYTTSAAASNYRVRAERFGASAPAQETNPAPIRYAIIDLGADVSPIRVTNSGYVLCQSTKFGKPHRRWFQGQFQDLGGGDDSALVGTRDIDEAGTVVGSVIHYQVGVPSPLIGYAGQYFGPDAWYRRPEVGRRAAAVWGAGSGAAVELGAPTFDFAIRQTPASAVYTGKVTNASVLTIDNSSGAIFGTALVDYQEEPAHYDATGNAFGTRWASVNSGFDFNSGTALGNQRLVPQAGGGFIVQGKPFYVQKARHGVMIGGESDSPASARYLNGLLVDFRPINLNSQGNALIFAGGSQPKYQIYETNTAVRTDLAAAASFSFTPAPHPAALNNRAINVTNSSGQSSVRTSPQVTGFFGTDFGSNGATIWEEDPKTGQYVMQYLNLMIPQNSGWNLKYAIDINDNGIITGTGSYADPSAPQAPTQTHAFMLVPAGLMVDGNRDGEMSSNDQIITDKDQTSTDKPYPFWVNDDQDAVSGTNVSDEITPPQLRDNQDEKIQNIRDCEDLARLWLNIGRLTEAFKTGGLKFVLRFRNVTSGNPAVRVFRAVENGGRGYVTSEAWGTLQATPPFDQALTGVNGPGIASQTSAIYVDRQFWSGIDESDPVINLLFEGVEEGKGELYCEIIKDGQRIGTSPGVWLDIKNVQKMYERAKAQPENIVAPYAAPEAYTGPVSYVSDPNGQSFEKPWDETDQCVIFVHGWNVSYDEYLGVAQTLFKRLWHQGFKGHFASLRWDTRKSDGMFDTGEYNRSENRAYIYGAALNQWTANLSNTYTVNLIGHSMGNIVCGEALRQGMQIRNYLLMEAAVPISCYDPNAAPLARLVNKDAQYPTPDYHRDPITNESTFGYRGYLMNVIGNLTNLHNPDDWALTSGFTIGLETNWEKNQIDYKPDGSGGGIHDPVWDYHCDLSKPLALRAWMASTMWRYVIDSWEMKAFIARSRTKAVGALANGNSVFAKNINLSGPPYNFGRERPDHSGQFTRDIQQVNALYDAMRKALEE